MSKEPTKLEVVRAVKNGPVETFEFGGRNFDIKDLQYDDYIEFLEYMGPLMEMFTSAGSTFDFKAFVKFAGSSLPRMVWLILHNQDKEITEDWIKDNAGTPYVLAEIAFKQVKQNRILEDFAGFFELIQKQMA